jgi:hypothetical protein
MKKHFIIAIGLIALVAFLLSFSFKQESTASQYPGFKGTAKSGRTVTACMEPDYFFCYDDVANAQNRYSIEIPPIMAGLYFIDDGTGCQPRTSYYDGTKWVTENFCVPPPDCPCW